MTLMVTALLPQPSSLPFQSSYTFPHILYYAAESLSTVLHLTGFASSVRTVFFPNSSHSPTTHPQELKDSQISCPRPTVTCDGLLPGSTRFWHAIWIAWLALANWMGSTSPWWPAWLFGSEMPTRYAAWKGRRKTAAQALCSRMSPWGTKVPQCACSSHA